MRQKPTLTVFVGPTASGKTDAAIAYAKQHNGTIVSADSRQVYAGMDIGTAKPEEAWNIQAHGILESDTIESVPHFLLNIRTPDNPLTLSDWQTAAYTVIDTIVEQGKNPVLVGGSMLYVDSVVLGYSIPSVPPNKPLRTKLETLSADELIGLLEDQDPDALSFIEKHNTRRIVRALEVINATGEKFSDIRSKQEPRYESKMIGLFPGWDTLEDRITKRVQRMLDQGLLSEVQKLQDTYEKDLPLLQTLDYKEAAALLSDTMTPDEATQAMVQANMRYAHRQMSWWRGRKNISWS